MVEIQAPSSSRARSWRPRSTQRRADPRSAARRRRVARVRDDEHRVDVEPLVADRAHEPLDEHASSCRCRRPPRRRRARAPRSPRAAPGSAPSSWSTHARRTRHIGQRSHHAGHSPPFGSCATSPARIRSPTPRACSRAPLDLRPERVVVEVVVAREPGEPSSRASPRSSPRACASPASGAVDAAERLDPDEVAQHEHVERDLEPQLASRSAPPSARSCPTCSPGRSRAR